MEAKMYNVYLGFYKKDSTGYFQRSIHTQVEAVSEEAAIRDVKLQFEINNKGFKLGTTSVIKVNTGFMKRDIISAMNLVFDELGRSDKKHHVSYYFDKWYMDYKVHRFDK